MARVTQSLLITKSIQAAEGQANLDWPYRHELNLTTHPSKQAAPSEEQA